MPLNEYQKASFKNHIHSSDQLFDAETGDPFEGGGGDAADIDFTPVGTIAATNVQAAIAEVATDAAAAYQPVDSDLTAIAALSTTAFGRGLLALADAAALAANHSHGATTPTVTLAASKVYAAANFR